MINCPNCGHWDMEVFGVTERGHYKYACPKCYHHIEIPSNLHKSWQESIKQAAENLRETIDKDIVDGIIQEAEETNSNRPHRVYLYERAVEERPMKKKYGWWAKYGHWTHTTFWKAMDHFIRGGKIRFGRW